MPRRQLNSSDGKSTRIHSNCRIEVILFDSVQPAVKLAAHLTSKKSHFQYEIEDPDYRKLYSGRWYMQINNQ